MLHTMSLDIDQSIPNQDTAVVQTLDPKSHRPLTNTTLILEESDDNYSPSGDVRAHQTAQWQEEFNLQDGTLQMGQLTCISGRKLGKRARLHISLAHNGKMQLLHRTRISKCGKNDTCNYEETFDFLSPPEAHLIFGAISYHMVRRDEHLGIAQIPLNDPMVNSGKEVCVNLGKGLINFRLIYPIGGVGEQEESFSSKSSTNVNYYYDHFTLNNNQYEEKVYENNVSV